MSETLKHANAIVEISVADRFEEACDRMVAHNNLSEMEISFDNPYAIAEELNTLLPWVDETKVEFVVDDNGLVVGLMDDDTLDPYDDGVNPYGTI